MEPAGRGVSVMWLGEFGMLWLAQALSRALQTKGTRERLSFFIVSFLPVPVVVLFVVLLQL
jgi:hypothetical protein